MILDRQWFLSTQPDSVREDPAKIAALHRERVQQYRDFFPEHLRRTFGNDPERYINYYRDNLEFLCLGQGSGFPLAVDEDVKGLGLSNRKVELLERCISMLEHGDQPDRALRVLKRYTTEDFADAKDWRTWFLAHRDRLFFTDVGGFKFMVAPESTRGTSGTATGRPEPDSDHPVVFQAELSPRAVRAGDSLDLVVRVKIAPNWHIYATERSRGHGVPTALNLKLPKGINPAGEWTAPGPSRDLDGQGIHEGTFEFRRKLRVDRDAALGSIRVFCELSYQACNLRSCQPPATEQLRAKAAITE